MVVFKAPAVAATIAAVDDEQVGICPRFHVPWRQFPINTQAGECRRVNANTRIKHRSDNRWRPSFHHCGLSL